MMEKIIVCCICAYGIGLAIGIAIGIAIAHSEWKRYADELSEMNSLWERHVEESGKMWWETIKEVTEEFEIRDNHVLELLKAESEGRLFVSPVQIGKEVWCVTRDEGAVYIDPERVVDVSSKGFYISEFLDGSGCGILVPYEEIGKSFFLTRELVEETVREAVDGGDGDG